MACGRGGLGASTQQGRDTAVSAVPVCLVQCDRPREPFRGTGSTAFWGHLLRLRCCDAVSLPLRS